MHSFILVWVLVVLPSTQQNSPIISVAMADLASCERLQKTFTDDTASSRRRTICVEIKIPVSKI